MDDDSSHKSPVQPARKGAMRSTWSLFWAFMLLIFIWWVFKVAFEKPEYRYQEVCYTPYVIGESFYVGLWGFINNQESALSYLERSKNANRIYKSCLSKMKSVPLLRTKIPYIND